ncbi:MAG: DEAD/DEAH box helicase [Staphylothermus sp.]|nr:DEAD/DEAH box helicase [Staphylothermus sp.]
MVVIKAKRWLDNDEFREVLKIADYNGYERGSGPVFSFNIEKALKNGYGFEDVLSLVEELGLVIEDIDELRKMYEKISVRIEWDNRTGYVKLYIPRLVFDHELRSFLKNLGSRYQGIVGEELLYRIIPYKLWDIITYFETRGLSIVDGQGLVKEKNLPHNISLNNVVLRPYQEEALEALKKNNYRGIIALPTGSGKTLIGVAAIASLNKRTLIITYTREQMFQWKEQIYRYTTAEPGIVGLIYSGEKRLAPITITTYQSGYRNIREISPFFDLLIVDEVHHLPADKFKYIALHSIARYRIGLSATPVREDGRHEELFPLLGGIVYHKTAAELSNQGYLARYRVITVKVGLKSDERKEFEKLRQTYRVLSGGRSFNEVLKLALTGNERAKMALRIHSQMKMLLAKSKAKIDKAVEIASKELEKGNKIIIFTQYVEQAKELAKRLNAYLLIGEIPAEKRKRILEEFKSIDRGILVVTTVGDEGLDIPDATVGIIVSGTGSRRQFIQRLGRIIRPKPGGIEAKLYEIVLEKTPEEFLARKRKRLDLDEFIH